MLLYHHTISLLWANLMVKPMKRFASINPCWRIRVHKLSLPLLQNVSTKTVPPYRPVGVQWQFHCTLLPNTITVQSHQTVLPARRHVLTALCKVCSVVGHLSGGRNSHHDVLSGWRCISEQNVSAACSGIEKKKQTNCTSAIWTVTIKKKLTNTNNLPLYRFTPIITQRTNWLRL